MKFYQELEKFFPIIEDLFSEYEFSRFLQCNYADLPNYHMGIGVRIRNDILHEQSPLRKRFVDIGVLHTDDMSAIILMCFYIHQKEALH